MHPFDLALHCPMHETTHSLNHIGNGLRYIAIFSAIGLGRSEVGGVRSIALGAIGLEWGFFLSQWEEHYVHVLRTSVFGVFGVTELQFIFIGSVKLAHNERP